MLVHSDSTSVIGRVSHIGTGPRQSICIMVRGVGRQGKTVNCVRIQRNQGVPGNEMVEVLAGQAAEKAGHPRVVSISNLELRILETLRSVKVSWHKAFRPSRNGTNSAPTTEEALSGDRAERPRSNGSSK
jgi:hypothetical protein